MKNEIPVWTQPHEIALIRELAACVPEHGLMVEVGALYGGVTAEMLLAAPKSARLIVVDDFSWTPDGCETASVDVLRRNLKKMKIKNFEIIEGDSRLIGGSWEQPIDYLRIDGGHSYDFVRSDLETFGVHASVISLHDYGNPFWKTIDQAISDFLRAHENYAFEKNVGTEAVLVRDN